MTYVVSDIHGEYDLFVQLLRKIAFSKSDIMYVCGDIIDKGTSPIRLAKLISQYPNIRPILGNHEYEFLKYYRSLMRGTDIDLDAVLSLLREYFVDGELLDWETVDWIESLPLYYDTEDFICVHAGIPLRSDGMFEELSALNEEDLVYDRHFKERTLIHNTDKCVFFGHTETACITGKHEVIAYLRPTAYAPYTIRDFYKVHLDTGSWSNGVLGCFCVDNCMVFYARRSMINSN